MDLNNKKKNHLNDHKKNKKNKKKKKGSYFGHIYKTQKLKIKKNGRRFIIL